MYLYANDNTSGLIGLIGTAVLVAGHAVSNAVVLRSLLLTRMHFYVVAVRVGLLMVQADAKFGLLCFSVLTCLCWASLHVEGGVSLLGTGHHHSPCWHF
jgi:hypothetical protein